MTVQMMRNSLLAASGLLSVCLAGSAAWAGTPKTSAKDLQVQTTNNTVTATSLLAAHSSTPSCRLSAKSLYATSAASQARRARSASQARRASEKPTAKPTSPPAKPVEQPNYSNEPASLGPVTSVSQLSDVRPTDWAFQALQSLVERYGCIVGYPDKYYRGNRALSRYEFAAGLNACMDRINELIAAGTADLVKKEDLLVVQKLQEEFAAELATLRGRVGALEARTATLEKQQFSTTTKLVGEAIFALNDIFGNQVGSVNNTVFQDRVRLGLQTSFTGKDVLNTRLAASNASPFLVIGDPLSRFVLTNGRRRATVEGSLASGISSQSNNNQIVLDRLDYTFPVSDRLKFYIAAAGGKSQYYVSSTVNPFFENFDGGSGSISAFSQESPIYRIGGGAGAGFNFAFDPKQTFVLSGGYLASNANLPDGSNGLFNGDFAALGQLTISPSDRLQVGLTYVRGYHTSGNSIFSLGFGNNNFVTGTLPANAFHTALRVSAVTNSYGAEVSFKLSPKLVINGFGGYTDLDFSGGGNGEIWYYGLGLAFPDLFKKGNLGGIFVGVEPYLGSVNVRRLNLNNVGLQNDTSVHVEGFYKFQLTDNISITPGVIWITAPDQNNNNDDYVVLTLRTTFSF